MTGMAAKSLAIGRIPYLQMARLPASKGRLSRGRRESSFEKRRKLARIVPYVISNRPGIGEPQEAEGPKVEQFTYQWTKQWYPLRVVEQLEQDRPNQAKLLGKDLVVWKDGNGRWNCFSDMCPHRMAPLSEGRVEADGNLLCAYHAWRFNGDGKCVKVPQAVNQREEESICSKARACATVYPTQELQGILWVWGESGPDALEESRTKSPWIVEEIEDPRLRNKIGPIRWSMFDLPYSWDYFMENVLDPAHVPVSHHGLLGSRYQENQQVALNLQLKRSIDGGFSSESNASLGKTSIEFQPPCRVRINQYTETNDVSALVLFATPTEPGRCIHIGAQLVIAGANSNKSVTNSVFFKLLRLVPNWILHLLAPLFLFQDLVLLHRQDRYRKKYVKDMPFSQAYNMQHWDRLVSLFRDWFQKNAGGAIPWPNGLSESDATVLPHNELFDVWRAHTQMCSICKRALRNIKRTRNTVGMLAVISCLAGLRSALLNKTASAGIPAQSANLFSAILFSGVYMGLNKVIERYYKHEFYHADNN